jgi:membrane associated rhomboid family serine protease
MAIMGQTPVSFAIIAVCVGIFLLQGTSRQMLETIFGNLALWPLYSGYFQPWQLFSYGFLHGGFNHLFFNMFAVFMFGFPLEKMWGSKRYADYFGICILGAGLIQLFVQYLSANIYPTIGASGAVFGLLLAYGVMWPNNKLFLIFFPVPIKAKWFVLIYGVAELIFGVTGTLPQVAHFAHLGGLFFGAGLLWRWGWRPSMTWNK